MLSIILLLFFSINLGETQNINYNYYRKQNIVSFYIIVTWLPIGLAARSELRATTDYICPGQNVTYECTVVNGSFTDWDVNIFEPGCEIVLSHFQFLDETKYCNNRGISARIVEVNNSRYTSQLVVSVTPDLNNGTINCSVDDLSVTLISSTIFNIVPPGKFFVQIYNWD